MGLTVMDSKDVNCLNIRSNGCFKPYDYITTNNLSVIILRDMYQKDQCFRHLNQLDKNFPSSFTIAGLEVEISP